MWEKIADGLVLTIFGMGVVFFVLSVNALATYPLKWLGGEKGQKVSPDTQAVEGKPEVSAADEVEPEVVAAITAALHYHFSRLSKVHYGFIRRTDVRRDY